MIAVAVDTRADFDGVAQSFAAICREGDVVLLSGDLGAGKTAFVQAAGRALGADDPITSPTYVLLQQYQGSTLQVLHADLYRLETPEALAQLDLTELIEDDAVAFIEWGERSAEFFRERCEITIAASSCTPNDVLDDAANESPRRFTFSGVGSDWNARLEKFVSTLAPDLLQS